MRLAQDHTISGRHKLEPKLTNFWFHVPSLFGTNGFHKEFCLISELMPPLCITCFVTSLYYAEMKIIDNKAYTYNLYTHTHNCSSSEKQGKEEAQQIIPCCTFMQNCCEYSTQWIWVCYAGNTNCINGVVMSDVFFHLVLNTVKSNLPLGYMVVCHVWKIWDTLQPRKKDLC